MSSVTLLTLQNRTLTCNKDLMLKWATYVRPMLLKCKQRKLMNALTLQEFNGVNLEVSIELIVKSRALISTKRDATRNTFRRSESR